MYYWIFMIGQTITLYKQFGTFGMDYFTNDASALSLSLFLQKNRVLSEQLESIRDYFNGVCVDDFVYGNIDSCSMINYANPIDKRVMRMFIDQVFEPHVRSVRNALPISIVNNQIVWGEKYKKAYGNSCDIETCIKDWICYINNTNMELPIPFLYVSFTHHDDIHGERVYVIDIDDVNLHRVWALINEMSKNVVRLILDLSHQFISGVQPNSPYGDAYTGIDNIITSVLFNSSVWFIDVRGTKLATWLRRDFFQSCDTHVFEKLVWIENTDLKHSNAHWFQVMIQGRADNYRNVCLNEAQMRDIILCTHDRYTEYVEKQMLLSPIEKENK